MEQFPGTLICTTNLPDQLDGAVLRRFHLRLHFDPLRPQQAADMFQERFGLAPKDTAALTDSLARTTYAARAGAAAGLETG